MGEQQASAQNVCAEVRAEQPYVARMLCFPVLFCPFSKFNWILCQKLCIHSTGAAMISEMNRRIVDPARLPTGRRMKTSCWKSVLRGMEVTEEGARARSNRPLTRAGRSWPCLLVLPNAHVSTSKGLAVTRVSFPRIPWCWNCFKMWFSPRSAQRSTQQ